MELAVLDGAVLPVAEARIPVTDEGLLRGDGVFEVVRLYGGRPYALDEHLARMTQSLGGHLLDSITRRRVLESTEVVERPVTVDELRSASGAALASTTREVQPVHHIEDIELDVNDALIRGAMERAREAIAAAL